jgi:hypothetical protein
VSLRNKKYDADQKALSVKHAEGIPLTRRVIQSRFNLCTSRTQTHISYLGVSIIFNDRRVRMFPWVLCTSKIIEVFF